MMPAPRPASASSACSKASTSQPSRARRLAASSPPSDPPMTNARIGGQVERRKSKGERDKALLNDFPSDFRLSTSDLRLPRACLVRGVIQLYGDLARVFDEDLVQA